MASTIGACSFLPATHSSGASNIATRMAPALPPIPLIPIRLSALSRCTPLTTYWDNGFYIACASSACGGKSELGLNVAAPECTMVGKRIVACVHCRLCAASRSACQWLRPHRSLPAAPGICCVRLPYPWRESISPLEIGRGCPTYRHRKFSNIVDR